MEEETVLITSEATLDSQPDTVQGSEHAARRQHKSRRYRQLEKKTNNLQKGLAGLSLMFMATLVVAAISLNSAQIAKDELIATNSEKETSIETLQTTIEELEFHNAQLVLGRIPNLKALEFGRILPQPAYSVESILFTNTGSNTSRTFEYMVVVRNDDIQSFITDLVVILFDENGIQIGSSLIKAKRELKQAESRSYSGSLEIQRGSVPKYFLIQ